MRNNRPGSVLSAERSKFYRNYSRHDNVEYFDDFLGDTLEASWSTLADTGGTVDLSVAAGSGVCTITLDTTDDDVGSLAHELNWFPNVTATGKGSGSRMPTATASITTSRTPTAMASVTSPEPPLAIPSGLPMRTMTEEMTGSSMLMVMASMILAGCTMSHAGLG